MSLPAGCQGETAPCRTPGCDRSREEASSEFRRFERKRRSGLQTNDDDDRSIDQPRIVQVLAQKCDSMSAARAGGPSGSTPLLSTANSRITMSIPISSSSSDQPPSFNGHTAASSSRSKIPSFHPGNILRATVKLSESSSNDYTAPIALFLVGSTTVNIMGNDRWQAGAQANIGGGGGSGMLITSMETHEFLRTPFVLLSSDSAREDVQEKAEKVEVHRGKGKGVAYGGGIYEAVLPGIEGFVAPTIVKSLDDLG